MSESYDLLEQKSHFAFGKNWASYAELVTDSQVEKAIGSLRRLAGADLSGKRFLDIGCGSGLHSLAALQLGASEVLALDIDPDSVSTTRKLLTKYAAEGRWTAKEVSVFELDVKVARPFDIVYSWGVLHHTGDMHRALRSAAALVAPGGCFVFALYARTALCWLWRLEKRWYAAASPGAQARARSIYVGLYRLLYPIRHRDSFGEFVANYGHIRGMDFYHDVHDWLGGWPYESISPAETERFMQGLGMRQVRSFVRQRKTLGLLGSGCDEYVYARD